MKAPDRTAAALVVAFVVFVAGGFFLPSWAVSLLIVSLARGLVALGLMVQFRSGLVSFGQALFFAVGGYAIGLAAIKLKVTDMIVLPLIGAAAGALLGGALGFLMRRYREIFFAMLSLAFSMILYGLLVKSQALGSTDGFNASARTMAGIALQGSVARYALFVLASLAAFVSTALLHRYLASHLGRLTPAVRDNELRVEYMGASVRNVVHRNVVIAAALAGAGGAVAALAVGHVDPETAYWTTSGEFVFVAILSGTGSVAAPFVGAVLLEVLRNFAYAHAPNTWQLVVGGVMLLVILFLPEGLWSLFRRRRAGTTAA
jgi:ABC-type branched-subunit amino acid transport system permease subunit